ncbi:unnamed protein product [Lepeophtheirus salmonis]|uniref:(salmon louse) hypothetical protein n=1 Tax=Lepeophtheirus salmonis TaxID=72036 RepID=A0A7R8CZK1_LEPSM|nr:unnamed protein product [Lepeophtheirus salmonis]CAF2976674.1 unnamed protein product [Lepeophtheirus salmonis]
MGDEDSPSNSTAPAVAISGDVVPGEDNVLSFNDFLFWMPMLVDSWWKILVCVIVVVLIFTLCCYCFQCCYFFWDCCSDPYWGYCPCFRTSGCEYCCKLRFCSNKKKRKKFKKMIPTISSGWKSGNTTKIDLGNIEDGKNSTRPPTSNAAAKATNPSFRKMILNSWLFKRADDIHKKFKKRSKSFLLLAFSPVKEEDEEGDEGSPFMYSSTPMSMSLARSTPTPFKSIRPPSNSLIPVKAIPESLIPHEPPAIMRIRDRCWEHDSIKSDFVKSTMSGTSLQELRVNPLFSGHIPYHNINMMIYASLNFSSPLY